MAKKNVKEDVSKILEEFLEKEELELWNVEFVKEVKDWFLRIYVDKKNPAEGEYVSIDDCEKVSRYLSEVLDEEDLIEQNYYLEVSSPGLDRVLLTDDHYKRYVGQLIEVKLYKGISGKKQFTCLLDEVLEDSIGVTLENEEKVIITKDQIAKANLAVVF